MENQKNRIKKKVLCYLPLIIVIVLFPFWGFTDEGVTENEIRIAQFGPLSGHAAAWGAVLKGSGLLFKIINDEGGICGRKIVYRQFDDSYNPAKTKSGVKLLQENIGIFAWIGGVGTATSLSVMDYLMKRNIPWISPVSGAKEFINPPHRYLYTVYPLYRTEARILCKFAVDKMEKKKIAILYQDDGYGRFALEGAEKELRLNKLELVAKLPIESTESQMIPFALKLKLLDADTVLLFITPYGALRLLRAALEINYFPQWMGGNSFSDFPLLYKVSRGMWEGMIATTQADLKETPLLQKYKKAFEKYAEEGEEWSLNYQYGIGIAEPLTEALKLCGCDLTREKLVEQLDRLKEHKGVLNKIKFNKFDENNYKSRLGTMESALIQCLENGKIKQLSSWIRIE